MDADRAYRCPACARTAPLDQWATHPRQGYATCPTCAAQGLESMPEVVDSDGCGDAPDDFAFDMPGDCHACDGSGEIDCRRCEGYGCSGCSDGSATCPDCDGSGFSNDYEDWLDEDGGPLMTSDMVPW